jgi:hypothetical protein
MFHASCHCGAVRIRVPAQPAYVIDCNCSLCRRNGALWATYESDCVELSGQLDKLVAYIWGQRSIRTMFCGACGCVTHWEPITAEAGSRFGINMRNVDPEAISGVRVRKFDGAESWAYLD